MTGVPPLHLSNQSLFTFHNRNMKKKNILWEFFASVKLALFTFITLAANLDHRHRDPPGRADVLLYRQIRADGRYRF